MVSGRVSEAAGAKRLLQKAQDGLARWVVLWVDGGYEDRIEDWVAEHYGIRVEVVKRPEGAKGWVLLPKRWVVERTFAWLTQCRRLGKDYEGKQ